MGDESAGINLLIVLPGFFFYLTKQKFYSFKCKIKPKLLKPKTRRRTRRRRPITISTKSSPSSKKIIPLPSTPRVYEFSHEFFNRTMLAKLSGTETEQPVNIPSEVARTMVCKFPNAF